MKPMSAVDLAYLAGLLDGEGCIGISCANTSKSAKSCRRGVAYRGYITITLTDFPLLRWVMETTGIGRITNKVMSKPRHKPAFKWCTWSREARDLAIAVLPYLKLKSPQAENLIAFQALMRQPGSKGLSDDEWDRRKKHHFISSEFNKRGVAA